MVEFDEKGYIAGRPVRPKDWPTIVPELPEGLIITRGKAPPGIFMVRNYLSSAQCEELVAECEKAPRNTSRIMMEESKIAVESRSRVCDSIEAKDLKFDVVQLVQTAFIKVIAPHFRRTIERFETPQILRYEPGGYYGMHADADNWIAEKKSWRRIYNRDLSLLIYFSSGYEGGELEFPNFGMAIKPQSGLLVAFPSDRRYAHIAHPTKAGVRYAMVSWALTKGSERVPEPNQSHG